MNRTALTLVMILFLAACGGSADREVIATDRAPAAIGPYSQAVRVGDTLYLSGQLGNLPGTAKLVPGGVVPETKQTLENIKATLERHGSSLQQVVKCTVFMADIDEWPKMNEVYRTYFTRNPPARSAVAGSGLALGARVEIECIAVVV